MMTMKNHKIPSYELHTDSFFSKIFYIITRNSFSAKFNQTFNSFKLAYLTRIWPSNKNYVRVPTVSILHNKNSTNLKNKLSHVFERYFPWHHQKIGDKSNEPNSNQKLFISDVSITSNHKSKYFLVLHIFPAINGAIPYIIYSQFVLAGWISYFNNLYARIVIFWCFDEKVWFSSSKNIVL